ncbi:MAG: glycosyltransferase family 39 protein [Candidatus Omnitrophica bacterium]|nr:glycosyltransferase family 39 protein [Candidatus Omnitrophota bacterium]
MGIFIFIFAFIIRVIVQYKLGAFVHPQTWEYEQAVNSFFTGRGLACDIYGTTYYSLLTPLYPAICILVYYFTAHSFFAMEIIQALVSSSICIVIFLIAARIFGKKTGFLAAILTVLHPGLVIYTAKLHPLVFDSLLICLVAWLLIRARELPGTLPQLKLGLTFGLSILTRSTMLLFLPFSWLWLIKGSKKKFLLYIFICLLTILPWIIRNYMIYKKITIVSSSANVFWRGNNPLATGTSLAASGKPMLEEAKGMMDKIYGKSELEQNRIFWEESLHFIKANPGKFTKLFMKKFFYFLWFAPTTGSEYKKEWLLPYMIFYSLSLFFGLIGLIAIRRLPFSLQYDSFIIIILILIIGFAQSLFYVETRHRWAIEPLFLIFSARGLISVFEIRRRKT